LEGSYLQWDDLGKSGEPVSPHPHYHDGRLEPDACSDVNDVTWWILKHRGLALIGPEPSDLAFQVDLDMLIARMKHNLNTYWAAYTNQPRRMAWLFADYGIQWAVLGVLRQYYTFQERDITSHSTNPESAEASRPSDSSGTSFRRATAYPNEPLCLPFSLG
jgi:hypothetical protein